MFNLKKGPCKYFYSILEILYVNKRCKHFSNISDFIFIFNLTTFISVTCQWHCHTQRTLQINLLCTQRILLQLLLYIIRPSSYSLAVLVLRSQQGRWDLLFPGCLFHPVNVTQFNEYPHFPIIHQSQVICIHYLSFIGVLLVSRYQLKQLNELSGW